MKVIFTQDFLEQKIKRDTVRDVADGYAQNFLFPRKLAVPATEILLKQLKHRAANRQRVLDQAYSALEKTRNKLRALTIEFLAKAEKGKLFGGIGASQILAELKKRGVSLEAKQLKLEHSLKTVGEHTVSVKLGEGVDADFKVNIRAEE